MQLDPIFIIPDDRKKFNAIEKKPNQKSATSLNKNCRDWRKSIQIWVINKEK